MMMYIKFIAFVANPLQGAFNCLIYLVPVFRKILKRRRKQRKLKEKEALKNYGEIKAHVSSSYKAFTIGSNRDSLESKKMILSGEDNEEEEKQEITSNQPTYNLEISKDNVYDEGKK